MENDRTRILSKSIQRLLRRNATAHLRKIVNKTHAADLSMVFRDLSGAQQQKVFNLITNLEQKGFLLSELDPDTSLALVQSLPVNKVVEVLEEMPNDDVADLIGRLPEETSQQLLEKMKTDASEEVEGLLRYKQDTAGGIMVPDFITLGEDVTAGEAIQSLQKEEHMDVEMPFYLYVTDKYGKLVGVSSLRQLVVVPPQTPLKSFMTTDVFSVRTDTDQEEVAKIVAKYDILAVPVVDHDHKLVGIVTVDDVIDIFRQEATEDFLKMAGAGEHFVETKSVVKSTRIRLPWLFASCLGGMVAVMVVGFFEKDLQQMTCLAAFIPVIMGMGGNIGMQSSTIVVRGLATARIHVGELWSVVSKEVSVGVILGIIYGTLIATVAQMRYGTIRVAISVGAAVLCSMSLAALVGSLVPMVCERMKIDPAVAAGPFVTTAIDILSVFFYFQIATTLLGM